MPKWATHEATPLPLNQLNLNGASKILFMSAPFSKESLEASWTSFEAGSSPLPLSPISFHVHRDSIYSRTPSLMAGKPNLKSMLFTASSAR